MQFFAAYHFLLYYKYIKFVFSPRSAKVISRMVWHFRAWRKSFPERFEVSALGESRFPNGLELVVAKIWKYSSKAVMPARVRKPKEILSKKSQLSTLYIIFQHITLIILLYNFSNIN